MESNRVRALIYNKVVKYYKKRWYHEQFVLYGCFARFLFNGFIAQSVEQKTENPCVAGSIPAGATIYLKKYKK